MPAHIDLLLGAEHRFIKFQVQIFAQIGSALGAAASSAALAEHVAKAEDVPKNVAEILEDRGIESRRPRLPPPTARVPEAVVQRSLLAVRQNRVRFGNLLELVFRVRIVRIAVGMVRHRQLAISALDFNLGGRTGHTEHFVKIAFCVCGQKLPQFGR